MTILSGKPGMARREANVGSDWTPESGNGFAGVAWSLLAAAALLLPFGLVGGWMSYDTWRQQENARLATIEANTMWQRMVERPSLGVVPAQAATHGREIFMTVCITCHGRDGTGVVGLGKNLAQSNFVAAQSDEEFYKFIVTGRPEARPVPMPPRAGRPDLTDEDLRDVVAYVRGLQDPRRMPALAEYVAAPIVVTEADKAKALDAAGGNAELAEYIASGTKIFNSVCIACHGAGGVGIPGNGKKLAGNEFIQSQNDDGLLAFVKKGRDPGDPKNTTGIAMPPRGGNPALSDDDLLDVISYLRTLQGTKPVASAGK